MWQLLQQNTPAGTRTRNLPLRRRMPYPLGHGSIDNLYLHNRVNMNWKNVYKISQIRLFFCKDRFLVVRPLVLRAQEELEARTTCVRKAWTWSSRKIKKFGKIFSQKKSCDQISSIAKPKIHIHTPHYDVCLRLSHSAGGCLRMSGLSHKSTKHENSRSELFRTSKKLKSVQ